MAGSLPVGNVNGHSREKTPVSAYFFGSAGSLRIQLQEVSGASEPLDAPLLDRWPETDQAIPACRLLLSSLKR
jgi:hypothetical protein